MKSYTGETNATDSATLVGTGELPNVPAVGFLAGNQYPTCDVAGGGVLATSYVDSSFFAQLTDEIQRVLALGSVASAPGAIVPDGSRTNMLEEVIGPIRALHSADAATAANGTTVHTRAVLAGKGTAWNVGTLCAANLGDGTLTANQPNATLVGNTSGAGSSITATAAQASVRSSAAGAGATIDASGAQAVVDGCVSANAGDNLTVSGQASCAVASGTQGANLTVAGSSAAAIGAYANTNGITLAAPGVGQAAIACTDQAAAVSIAGSNSAVIGSDGATLQGDQCVDIGSTNSVHSAGTTECATIASDGAVVGGNCLRTAVIGSSGGAGVVANMTDSVCLAATGGALPTLGGLTSNQVWGGNGANATWRIDGVNGTFYATAGGGGVAAAAPSFNMAGADFAELFVNVAGAAIPKRRLVTRDANGVRMADDGARVLGVTTDRPGVLGNSPDNGNWQRPEEWVAVGLLGQVLVEMAHPFAPADFVRCGDDGRGLPCSVPDPRDRRIEVLHIVEPFDVVRGYGVAACLVG